MSVFAFLSVCVCVNNSLFLSCEKFRFAKNQRMGGGFSCSLELRSVAGPGIGIVTVLLRG